VLGARISMLQSGLLFRGDEVGSIWRMHVLTRF